MTAEKMSLEEAVLRSLLGDPLVNFEGMQHWGWMRAKGYLARIEIKLIQYLGTWRLVTPHGAEHFREFSFLVDRLSEKGFRKAHSLFELRRKTNEEEQDTETA